MDKLTNEPHTEKSTEEWIREVLTSNNASNLSEEKIQHLKNITREVAELDKLNSEGNAYAYVAILLLFMGGNTFNTNKEEISPNLEDGLSKINEQLNNM